MNSSKLLDVEFLEQFSFERSKMWGEFLNMVSAVEDNREIKFDDVDKVFEDECDENDSNEEDSSVDVEDDDILQDITNRSIREHTLSSVLHSQRKINAMVRSRASSILNSAEKVEEDEDDDNNDESETERQNILNQTKPIFEEHERKWKEAGLDVVLNTFDPQKIEEKVGGWLRRNHSTASSQGFSPVPKFAHTKPQTCCSRDNNSDSDQDSLHSVDTARYIRSSRKRLESRRRCVDPYTTSSGMTIKTFRMVQSKREELREKYACLDEEGPLHSEKKYHSSRCTQCSYRSTQAPLTTAELFNLKHSSGRVRRHYRRKCLRKRRYSSSCDTTSSLSSSEDEVAKHARYTGRSVLQRHRHRKQPPTQAQRWATCCARGCRTLPLSELSQPTKVISRTYDDSSPDEMPRHINRELFDKRPCKWESECDCHNDRKLCNKTLHIAKTSTEDWVVENCVTPQKIKRNPMHAQMLTQTAPAKVRKQRKAAKRTYPKIEEADEHFQSERKEQGKAIVGKAKQEQRKVTKTASSKKSKSRSAKLLNEVFPSQSESDTDAMFRKELELALTKSVETYEKERHNPTNFVENAASSNQTRDSVLKDVTPAEKAESKMSRLAERQSSLDSMMSLGSTNSLTDDKSDCSSLSILKPQPRFAKLRKLSKMITEGSTFLSSCTNICNSTALNGDKAAAYQIIAGHNPLPTIQEMSAAENCARANRPATSKKTKRQSAKHTSNVSSTKRNSPSTSSSSASSVIAIKSSNKDDDQIMVTSSTDVPGSQEAGQSDLIPAKHTAKGILLYAPNSRNLAPRHSVVDGFFHVTFEHLSSIIGEKAAGKFMKYYLGRRRFLSSSSVYYRPPESLMLSTCAETDSDDDVLESVGQYGELYESLNKDDKQN